MRLGFLLVLVLSIGLVSAVSVCIDNVAPSAPLGLGVSGNVGSILLKWDAAVDEPSCSGIDEYVISREGVEIGRVDGDVLSFVDNASLGNGEYTYTVYAVDLVGHNTGAAIKNVISIGGGGRSSRGSSITSFVCVEDWSCDEWSECVGNDMRRLCNDLNECGTVDDKPEVYQGCGESSGGEDMTIENVDEEADVGGIGGFFSAITGGVIGGGAGWGIIIIVILIVGGSYWYVKVKRKKKRK